MARFYFDFHDEGGCSPDEVGSEMETVAAIRLEAAQSLAELAADILKDGVSRKFGYVVRDEAGKTILKAMVTFALDVEKPSTAN